MNGELVAFFVLSICVLGGAVLMLTLKKVVHMVVALAFSFISVAGIFILLSAEFIAAAQVLIYGGAITIIMLFGIMLTKHDDLDETRKIGAKILAGVTVIGFFLLTFYAINQIDWGVQETTLHENNTAQIGIQLFAKYVIPFELTSILLLVALVGAIILARRDDDVTEEELAEKIEAKEAEENNQSTNNVSGQLGTVGKEGDRNE